MVNTGEKTRRKDLEASGERGKERSGERERERGRGEEERRVGWTDRKAREPGTRDT